METEYTRKDPEDPDLLFHFYVLIRNHSYK